MDYKFTEDWFAQAIPAWKRLRPLMRERKRFLEIGSFEGRSTVWTVENLLDDGGTITCIDSWAGSTEHHNKNMVEVEERFDHNQNLLSDRFPARRVFKVKGPSYNALKSQTYGFDMVYIDGSHHGLDVMTDACLAWPLLKNGGFLIFDDYEWMPNLPPAQTPKLAIDTFLTLLDGSYSVFIKSYQVIIKKEKNDPRGH
jgi:predicted O-methyltransferase YrrM